MDARVMYDLEEILCKELEPYSKKGGLARNDLEAIFYLTGGLKNLKKVSMMEEQGNSYGEWSPIDNASNTRIPGGRYSNSRTSYDNGSYYGSSGRMSRDGYSNDGSSGRMSRDGYSNDGDMYERMRMRMEDGRM